MALGIAEIIILGLLADWLVRQIKIPGLVGMLLVGVLMGPCVLAFFSPGIMRVASDLQMIALVVLLLRAGFELSTKALARVGFRVLALACLPCAFEALAVTALGPFFLGLSYLESAILGAILGAVSLAVVVPYMIDFIKERRGVEKAIPTLVLASSSLNNVLAIVVFSVLLGLYIGGVGTDGGGGVFWKIVGIPISIVSGMVVGLSLGWVLYRLFEKFNPRATKRVLILLGLSIFLLHAEKTMGGRVPFSALVAIMSIGIIILEKREHHAHEMSSKLGKFWIFAELVIFVMIGASVNIDVVWSSGLAGAALIACGLVARSVGTYVCLIGSELNTGERLFTVVSHLPKATMQAAIGAAPLAAMKAAGLSTAPGEIILAVAVLSIVLTAPLGAWAVMLSGKRCLEQAPPDATFDAIEAVKESE